MDGFGCVRLSALRPWLDTETPTAGRPSFPPLGRHLLHYASCASNSDLINVPAKACVATAPKIFRAGIELAGMSTKILHAKLDLAPNLCSSMSD